MVRTRSPAAQRSLTKSAPPTRVKATPYISAAVDNLRINHSVMAPTRRWASKPKKLPDKLIYPLPGIAQEESSSRVFFALVARVGHSTPARHVLLPHNDRRVPRRYSLAQALRAPQPLYRQARAQEVAR